MDTEQKRIIALIEDVEELDTALSMLDYEMELFPDKQLDLKDEYSRLRDKRNKIVNDLRFDEAVELEWDGESIWVKKDSRPYLMYKYGKWEVWSYQMPLIGG